MRKLKRLASLTGREQVLLLRAFRVVVLSRAALFLVPYAKAQQLAKAAAVGIERFSVDQFAWAVKAMSAFIPRANCLTQALALQALLSEAGHPCEIEIGVTKDADRFAAHAWVVCENRIVIGGPNVEPYARLAECPRTSL